MKNILWLLGIVIIAIVFAVLFPGEKNLGTTFGLATVIQIVSVGIFVLIAYLLSFANAFFSQIESGDVAFVESGKSLVGYISDVKGRELKIVDGNLEDATFIPGEEKKTWLQSWGIYWIGVWPLRRVHGFWLQKATENLQGAGPANWIKMGEKVLVFALRQVFPRPFVLLGSELGDLNTVNILAVCKIEVIKPYKVVYQLKGDIFNNLASMIASAVNDLTKNLANISEFKSKDKAEGSEWLAPLLEVDSVLNKKLLDLLGLRLVGINLPISEPADKTVDEASKSEAIAKLKALGVKAEAEGYAIGVQIKTEADRNRQIELAKGRQALLKATVDEMKLTGVTGDELIRAVTRILEMQSVAESDLTTLVQGKADPVINLKP